MGADLSVDAVYTLGETIKYENPYWQVYPAVNKKDEVSATVFIHDKKKDGYCGIDKAVKFLRTLRHPGILKCHEVLDNTEELSVVTEPVVPLTNVIEEFNTEELIAGIHGITTALAFLHKCKLSHNNLSLDSIFVGQNDACWKISGFECMLKFSDMTNELLTEIKPIRELESIPPEGENIGLGWAHAQDAFGLGKLILDIFHETNASEDATVDNFLLRVEAELLHSNYEERPQIICLLNDDVFQNGYIEILEFLNNITIKSIEEKAVFFRDLHHKLQGLPPRLVANRLLHLLLSRFVLVDPVAVEVFLPHLLTPLSNKPNRGTAMPDIIPLLPCELYKESCLPILRKLFDVKDRHVRMILLKYFHLYVGMFEKDVLQKVVLQELMLGLRDSDDELVSSTFSALQHLVPLLGSKIVIGGERIQQFTERRPNMAGIARLTRLECHDIPKDEFNKNSLPNKATQDKSKTVEDKIKDREKRREETRKRNEERKKANKLLQVGKLMTKKVNEVEEIHCQSDNDFESWGDLSNEREQLNIEVSDGSEPGIPSSSEISLDSGYSERVASPTILRDTSQRYVETNTVKKLPAVKGPGMKLNKSMQSSKIERNQILNVKKSSASTTSLHRDAIRTMSDKDKKPSKKISLEILDKKKTVDVPWEDFGINVKKNGIDEEDLFADMAPSLSCTPTAQLKGTSIYSDKLAVEISSCEVADGWNDDEW